MDDAAIRCAEWRLCAVVVVVVVVAVVAVDLVRTCCSGLSLFLGTTIDSGLEERWRMVARTNVRWSA